LDFRQQLLHQQCILLEEPTYLRSRKDLWPPIWASACQSLFRSGTKWYRQSDKYKIVAEKLGIHQSEIIAVGNAGNDCDDWICRIRCLGR
jgi:hypothetical protein